MRSFQAYSTSSSLQGSKFFSRSYAWQIVSALALRVLWEARCSKLYNDENTNVVDQVKTFWDLLVHTVKGDYDNYKGSRNTTNRKKGEFDEFGHLFLLCWLQALMSGGTTYHLVGCSRHRHHS